MSKSDRNNPKRSTASESTYTLMDFDRDFPDDSACMDWLVGFLYPDGIYCPKCEKVTKHHRVKSRTSYSCQYCGHHEHPMRGTIFENSATSLRLWFHGIFLMSQTRCGISAKQLERELGVTYKTAWRMFNKIRSMLAQDDEPFSGNVEADETYVGGNWKWRKGPKEGRGVRNKDVVFGVAQRGEKGSTGKVKATVVPHNDAASLIPEVQKRVVPETMIFTDELRSYRRLPELGYGHQRVSHSTKVWVRGDAHTNTIEGFWSLMKRGIGGVYHGVSTEHLQSYLDEYVFRYNNRDTERGMFHAFLERIVKVTPA